MYYVESGSGYVIVGAPVGGVVYAIPRRRAIVYAGSTPYYYYGGTYYIESDEVAEAPPPPDEQEAPEPSSPEPPQMTDDGQSYEVVAPPVGATVAYLPEGATQRSIGGQTYFFYEETYYRMYSSGADTVYMVVEDPTSRR